MLFRSLLVVLFLASLVSARPNVVLVMTDDQGYGDIGIHDNKVIRTPTLDRFGKAGVQLSRFYCSPVCAPTRASLLTGRYYYRTGVVHTSRGGAKMAGDEATLAELFAKAGYRTGIFGKWHLGDNAPMRPQDQGFAESLVHRSGGIGQTPDKPNSYFDSLLWHNGKRFQAKGYCTDVFFDATLKFLGDNRDKPFFVYLPTNAPHTPLEIAEKYSKRYLQQGVDATTAKVYGMCTNIDDNFARLLAKLDALGLREKTIVVFLTDNGPQQSRFNAGFRGRKGSTYEGGIRVPCFVQWPGTLAGERMIDRIAAHIDIGPTLLDLCGVEVPANMDGKSLAPLLKGDAKAWPARRLFFQCHRGLTPQLYQNCAVVTQRYKLLGYPGTFSREDLNTTGEPMLALYDLQADPGEKHDLAKTKPDVVRDLRTRYEKWFADVKGSRNFTPGTIVVDTKAEKSVHLSRYQDCTYVEGKPRGWQIELKHSGRYRIAIVRDESTAGSLHVRWQGKSQQRPLAAKQRSTTVELSQGKGTLEIWFEKADQGRRIITDNSILGNVTLSQ